MLANLLSALSPATPRKKSLLQVEALEDRLVPSWTGVPPSAIVPPAGAVAVSLSGAAVEGDAAVTANEVDYYTFLAPVSGTYTLSATTPASGLDPVLGVFGSGGQRLAYNDDVSSSDTDSSLQVTLNAGARYYVGITNYTGTGCGSYTWRFEALAGGDDAYEDNDSIGRAYSLGQLSGPRTVGNLVMADSQDWFSFRMAGAGTSAHSVAIRFRHDQGDLDLKLFDAGGNLVRVSDGYVDDEPISLSGLGAGTYYVQVYGYDRARNPGYSLEINPATSGAGGSGGGRVLYLNFDGATISRSDLVRWAGSDWAHAVNDFDADGNGIRVGRFLANRGDREQIIGSIISRVQQDLRPFGLTVRRHTGLAVENQYATTIFLGPSTLTNGYVHVAAEVDHGNNNRTDIAFVGDETGWGSAANTAMVLSDVTLHEAGHTYGLWHVASGTYAESMGLRYSTPSSRWLRDTSFLDRTFAAFVDANGHAHGSGPQNSYQKMMRTFVGASAPAASLVLADVSRQGVLSLTTTGRADRVRLRRLASGSVEVRINGRVYVAGEGVREIHLHTRGDRRDRIRVLGDLGAVRLRVNPDADGEVSTPTKVDGAASDFWAGLAEERQSGCSCPLCTGRL